MGPTRRRRPEGLKEVMESSRRKGRVVRLNSRNVYTYGVSHSPTVAQVGARWQARAPQDNPVHLATNSM